MAHGGNRPPLARRVGPSFGAATRRVRRLFVMARRKALPGRPAHLRISPIRGMDIGDRR